MDYLQSECHQTALQLISSGSAIIAELFRLSNHIPDVFLFQMMTKQDSKSQSKAMEQTYLAANGKTLDSTEVKLRYSE